MKITVNTRTVFLFPTALIFDCFTAGIIRRKLKKGKIRLTTKQIKLFIKEFKRYRKKHTDWNLVEIENKNGYTIKVRI